jgi:hypothetical protein
MLTLHLAYPRQLPGAQPQLAVTQASLEPTWLMQPRAHMQCIPASAGTPLLQTRTESRHLQQQKHQQDCGRKRS